MSVKLRQETALNLTLEGSTGSFKVGAGLSTQNSLEVKYFLTHVGLNFSIGSNDSLLTELAPVREIFDFNELDFDEIMQRDIDDARVSSELIPYILDNKTRDLIKFFPPVVVVVLPVQDDRNKPLGHYPAVVTETVPPQDGNEHGILITRSGAIGQEAFQFEQPVINGIPLRHDLVRLRVNTHRTRLVIVDGQHRAMALLAIYRNLKDKWSDERRAPFREYYSEWTPNYIGQFHLDEINLPVILCTVPSLDANYTGDFDLKKAARVIFLTLNKTARKVSNSRNILLNDNDIIAYFLRRCLSKVKQKDVRSADAFRIWNVELDQFGDKMKIQSPVAITGVSHIYYIVEHILLNGGTELDGFRPRSGRFSNRTYLADCLDRLDGRNLLGAAVSAVIRRENYSADAAAQLGQRFDERFGRYILAAFERFKGFENHNRAALNLEVRTQSYHDRQLRPILFEGQGIGRVFEAHRSKLKEKLKEGYFQTDVPEIEAAAQRLDSAAARIETALQEFAQERADLFLSEVSDRGKLKGADGNVLHPVVVKWVSELYDIVFSTVAFQSALICGFFAEFEKAQPDGSPAIDRDAVFDEYISQLNAVFTPASTSQLKKLIRVFTGDVQGDRAEEWKIVPSSQTFRSVVYRGEMQPDQWPRYKYLLLEQWNPTNEALASVVQIERKHCRDQVFASLKEWYTEQYCREHRKSMSDLTRTEQKRIFNQAFDAYSGFLKNLGAQPLVKESMEVADTMVAASDANVSEESNDGWSALPTDSGVMSTLDDPDDVPVES